MTSRFALCEIKTTLCRKEAEGILAAGMALMFHERLIRDWTDGHIRVVEFSTEVESRFHHVLTRCFGRVPPLHVRTLDAIHLSSAIAAGESEFVATDKRLRDAALSLGMKLFPQASLSLLAWLEHDARFLARGRSRWASRLGFYFVA